MELENNSKTEELSKNFESTEELINKNKEIEEKLTSTSLIEFYLNAVQTQNELISSKDKIEKDFDRINNAVETLNSAIFNITGIVDKQKEENKYKETIDTMSESFDTLKTFGNKLVNKLNNVTIISKTNTSNTNKVIFEEEKEKDYISIMVYVIIIAVIGGVFYGLYKFFT